MRPKDSTSPFEIAVPQEKMGDMRLHAVQERGSDRAPQPLLLHGWPYSCASFLGVIDRLAHPERFERRAS